MSDIRDSRFSEWYLSLDTQRMTATVQSDSDDGATREVSFRYEVCSVCQGRGEYTNPNIDRQGLSQDDFDQWGDEEISDYFSGAYNVRCEYCQGRAVEPVTDDKAVLADIAIFEADMREWQAEIDLESRMLGEY
jgi:hypothetical protein